MAKKTAKKTQIRRGASPNKRRAVAHGAAKRSGTRKRANQASRAFDTLAEDAAATGERAMRRANRATREADEQTTNFTEVAAETAKRGAEQAAYVTRDVADASAEAMRNVTAAFQPVQTFATRMVEAATGQGADG
ncbi:MAG: hypothetical protein JWQ17_207, partial [Tardiphaga sp.]|nr:hypothetical protein [Tardiphaga sp.]